MNKLWNKQSEKSSTLLKNMTSVNYKINIILSVLYVICGIISICLEKPFFLWFFTLISMMSFIIAIYNNFFQNKNKNEFDNPIYSFNFLAICVGRLSIRIERKIYTYRRKIFLKKINHRFISLFLFIVVLFFQIFIFLKTFEYKITDNKMLVDFIIKISRRDMGLIYTIILSYGFINGGFIILMYIVRTISMIAISDEDYKKILIAYSGNGK